MSSVPSNLSRFSVVRWLCELAKGRIERDIDVVADLVTKTLGCNDGNFIADTLVGFEVQGQFGVVAFDDDFGGLLDGLYIGQTRYEKMSYQWSN